MVVYGQSLGQWTSCRVNGSSHGSSLDIIMQVLLHVITHCLDKHPIAHSCFFLLTKGYTMESLSSSSPKPTREDSSPGFNTVDEEEGPPSYCPFSQRETVFDNLCPRPKCVGQLVGSFQPQEEMNRFLAGYEFQSLTLACSVDSAREDMGPHSDGLAISADPGWADRIRENRRNCGRWFL
jgi:hypothetical protein